MSSPPPSRDPWEESGRTVGKAGLALMLPMTMAISPIIGYFAGAWIGRKVGWEPAAYVGLGIGIVSGVRQSLDIIRKLNAPGRGQGKEPPKQ